ncbi:hypothetical protein [Burkholderia oklahomensis]|uniref:hypothetical protein n=1 Tax=Burkholderia oklahomensis TaxID=342113 RepID=UPI00047427BE|nr:hypothetical protein [Burkholderia oklahomensis]AOI49292.1 hypothetical protein WI23_26270 [Burkholderia oklahomensis C6786]KUY60661.1 hypothetical protein WI23_13235 [Burkholderia oklahomensis C6786]MBI0362461.1 hypothetical protein [Burkholderia oklahomensis]
MTFPRDRFNNRLIGDGRRIDQYSVGAIAYRRDRLLLLVCVLFPRLDVDHRDWRIAAFSFLIGFGSA